MVEGYNYGIFSATTSPASGHYFTLTNTGTIIGNDYGVFASVGAGDALINNSGTIMGVSGGIFIVPTGSNSTTTIVNSGIIQGGAATATAINVTNGLSSIVNSGTINGAVNLAGSGAILTNSGTINGYINGTAGADIFTFSGGSVSGTVSGGAGNDLYNVDSAGLKLAESPGNGSDAVNSTVSYTLGTNFENLSLSGTASINGTGNNQANSIGGNSADNTLRGAGGMTLFWAAMASTR